MVYARGRAGTSAPGERARLARRGVCNAGVARAHQELCARGRARAQNATKCGHESVSYTHLTLPTICSV
eukprot:11577890-Alexandrium_andersonii.AAC.1